MTNEKRYDVVIYNDKTRKIESVVGKDMRLDTGFHNAEKRAETAWGRINDAYSVAIIEAGLAVGAIAGKNVLG